MYRLYVATRARHEVDRRLAVRLSVFCVRRSHLLTTLSSPYCGHSSKLHDKAAFHSTMPPVAVPVAAPPAARTTFTFVPGAAAAGTAPAFTIVDTSPLVTSLVLFPWELGAAGTPAQVIQSAVVGAIVMATRRPCTDPDLPALC